MFVVERVVFGDVAEEDAKRRAFVEDGGQELDQSRHVPEMAGRDVSRIGERLVDLTLKFSVEVNGFSETYHAPGQRGGGAVESSEEDVVIWTVTS